MSMLLNVLAESLGFSGKSSKTNIDVESEDYSEDSSYEDLPNVSPTKCALQDCMQKELLANFLEQGEQPPALDDISTAEDKDMNESILSHESTTDDFENVYQVNEPAYVLSEVDNHSTLTKINREGDCGKIVAQSFYDAELAVEHTTGNATEKKIQTPESSKSDRMNDTSILKQDDHMQISDVVHKESQYSSESKVFKRITELNSIENSDDNSTDCDDYTVPFSLSKLSGKVDAWDINSDYYSDTDSDTEKFFEHQEMKTTLKFCGKIGVQSELKMQNSVTDFNKLPSSRSSRKCKLQRNSVQ
ncbi:hypothetical protein DPMN_011230 [Dreissena polymorpha]|uniref:Uncharacterized protein n=1 Tax=Dreissena polymorpha TaxID=45954 RepID=A0A9D4N4M4_DREPO|nr:hypothetical protein DPMN_011230 [Dreissena polymorpha]